MARPATRRQKPIVDRFDFIVGTTTETPLPLRQPPRTTTRPRTRP